MVLRIYSFRYHIEGYTLEVKKKIKKKIKIKKYITTHNTCLNFHRTKTRERGFE